MRSDKALKIVAQFFFRRTTAECIGEFFDVDDHGFFPEPQQTRLDPSGSVGSMRVSMGNIHKGYLFRHLFALKQVYTKTMHMGVAAG